MKNNKKVIQFPTKPPLRHYSEMVKDETQQTLNYLEGIKRRADEIMKKTKKRDNER